jgi:hypothetical protein
LIGHPLKVRELLDEIARGEILLPEFQRSYVWRPHQVVCLIDSLYQDYPTGQLLLWDTTEEAVSKGLEGVSGSKLGTVGRPKIVLDGQQRLTSLHKAFDPSADNPVEVLFNLASEQFVPHQARLAKDPVWVGVRAVLCQEKHDLEILQEIAAAGGPGLSDPEARDYLDRLRQLRRILEYPMPVEIFRSNDFEKVIELFIRVNSGGTRLHQAELVLAQLTLRLPGAIVKKVERALDSFEARDFSVDSRFLVRALVAVGTGQSRFKRLAGLWERSDEDLAELWKRTEGGLERAVEFVRSSARLPSSEWLPSLNALIPLVAFFARHPSPSRKQLGGLLRWFYLTALQRRFSASAETRLDEDLKAVASDKPVAQLLERLLSSGGRLSVGADDLRGVGRRNPLYPLALAAAVRRGAVDWFSGAPLSAGQRIVAHSIHPAAVLKKNRIPRAERDEIAGQVFLSAEPARTIAGSPATAVLSEVARAGVSRLEAQSVPLDRDLWAPERYRELLASRREALAESLNELLDDPLG